MDFIKPNKGRLVVRPLEQEEVSKSGIIVLRLNIHETARHGEVMYVSEDCPFEVGKTILFPPFAGDAVRVEIAGKFVELRILRFESILASL
jgi:co-chaperonin GroES (HSP10)